MTTISACLVVYNEELLIERCLRSLEGAVDEIVVVHDGPCTDRTLELARSHGCRIVIAEHSGVAEPHRPLSFELATGDWILRIDADEFLSDELNASLRKLVEIPGIDGWEFAWPIWGGTRYVTEGGRYKRVLVRRSAARELGVTHWVTGVRGRVERSELRLEHRPLTNKFVLRTWLPKSRQRTRLQARAYLSDWSTIPKFGFGADEGWPRWRRWSNRLSPLLFLPYGLLHAVLRLRELRGLSPLSWRLRLAFFSGLNAAWSQAQVARFLYLDRFARR